MLRMAVVKLGSVPVLAVIAASMVMNFQYGYGFGTSAASARAWGALSVAVDALKAALPVIIAWHWSQRHWARAGLGIVILPLALGFGFLSALGFGAESRNAFVGGRDSARMQLEGMQADLAAATTRRAALADYRLAGEVKADLAGAAREPLWLSSKGCRYAAKGAARAFCSRVDGLQAELARAAEGEALDAKTQQLNGDIRAALQAGAWREADPLSRSLAAVFGSNVMLIGIGLSWYMAVMVEMVSCFGLLVVDQARRGMGTPESGAGAEDKPAPWRLVGKLDEALDGKVGA